MKFKKFTHSFFKRDYKQPLALAVMASVIAFSAGTAYTAWSATDTLTVTVLQSMTFVSSTNTFPNITPGQVVFATTTLDVATNDALGYFVTLAGDQKNSQPQNNLQLNGATSTQIADTVEWVAGGSTTTPGTATAIAGFLPNANVLAFRVMTASGTTDMRMTGWWGTVDSYTPTNANTLWAGIPSSTVSRKIINASAGSYSASHHLGSVNYYLSVSATQLTGAYSAPLTYSATGN